MVRDAWWIAVLVGWLVMPVTGWACSCSFASQGLASTLEGARDSAGFIYLGRVRDSEDPSERFATVDVLEAFKGSVKAGAVLRLPYGGGGDCVLNVTPGRTWLIYAGKTGPEEVWMCSRSRRVLLDDSELTWLRTGVLPPVPVALHRETVSCEGCEIEVEARRLLAHAGTPPVGWREAEARWKAGQPFITSAGMTQSRVLGVSRDGRAFELSDSSLEASARWACERRLQLRWCKRLELQEGRYASDFRCVDPGEPQEVCDERRSRKSEWLPMERLPPGACSGFNPSAPSCDLASDRFPFPAGAPPLPFLACHPLTPGARSGGYACEVKTAPEPAPPAP
ncbi:hypothetical protein NR800_17855 [Corallococcus interemptor]|uniref:hypothetical protein n=1 Tax=Corallococcus interemptor TaxID=2316720 RepID=UPI0035D3F020